MTTPDGHSPSERGITRVSVEGYKSLRTRQDMDIRPLTILAGVNSSGKSSAMQPLLLLKQTLDTPYDPGPLQLSGPSVDITSVDQVLSRPTRSNGQRSSFRIGVTVANRNTEWRFGKDRKGNLRILEMAGWFLPDQSEPATLREDMTDAAIREALPSEALSSLMSVLKQRRGERALAIARERCFLRPEVRIGDTQAVSFSYMSPVGDVELELSTFVHLPALRGNPKRTYPTVAVEDRFPGTFETYTAGIIAAWQSRRRSDRMRQLRADLDELCLTWKVEARQLDDTQVELMVGRLPRARRGGAHDLVNIADVGFGVSQTLPVVVALLAARPGQLVFLEQPEIHLHPRAQVGFANLLQRAAQRGIRVVVETHSALLVRAVQTLVAGQRLLPEHVILHWFSRDPRTGDTEIATAELDRAGAFGTWPEDFDEVYLETESRYLDAAGGMADT